MSDADDELNREIARCFAPSPEVVERIKARSLSARPQRLLTPGRSLFLGASLATAVALLAVGVWIRRPTAPVDAEVMTATFDGDVLLVHSATGRTWVTGPPARSPRLPGDWTIAVHGEEK
jgi:hypothetical protein